LLRLLLRDRVAGTFDQVDTAKLGARLAHTLEGPRCLAHTPVPGAPDVQGRDVGET
jgi:hypothetical protein